MAIDTSLTTQTAGTMVALDNVVQVYQRVIDFSKNNLASGAHFELFTIPANSIILTGWHEVLTADAGGGSYLVGYGGTGHEIINSHAVSATSAEAIDHVGVSWASADTVDMSATAAAITTAKVRVTLVVMTFTRGASTAQHDAT